MFPGETICGTERKFGPVFSRTTRDTGAMLVAFTTDTATRLNDYGFIATLEEGETNSQWQFQTGNNIQLCANPQLQKTFMHLQSMYWNWVFSLTVHAMPLCCRYDENYFVFLPVDGCIHEIQATNTAKTITMKSTESFQPCTYIFSSSESSAVQVGHDFDNTIIPIKGFFFVLCFFC